MKAILLFEGVTHHVKFKKDITKYMVALDITNPVIRATEYEDDNSTYEVVERENGEVQIKRLSNTKQLIL